MLKKTILFLIFLFTASCGYEAIYSKKNQKDYDFSISEIYFVGDRDVNIKIKQRLNNYVLNKKTKEFRLTIKSIIKKEVLVKDAAGDPTNFETTLTINTDVFVNNILRKKIKIEKKFKYNNNADKFALANYEKSLQNNLAESISNELIFKLSNIK